MTITELTPIGEIAAAVPSNVRVFQRHGIDFCCGGKRALGAVCREQGLSFAATVDDIQASDRPTGDDRDWTTEPLGTLIDHIITAYHRPLREELPRLRGMASQVARVHAAKAGYLARINKIVEALSGRFDRAHGQGRDRPVPLDSHDRGWRDARRVDCSTDFRART